MKDKMSGWKEATSGMPQGLVQVAMFFFFPRYFRDMVEDVSS